MNIDDREATRLRHVARRIGAIDAAVEVLLRRQASGNVCNVHAFGIEVNGCAHAIMGVSGAGKTTFGLACCLAGAGFMGDEYGYLDLDAGAYWHASHPVCVKEGTNCALGWMLPSGAPLITPFGLHAQAIPEDTLLNCLAFRDSRKKSIPLKTFILPHRVVDSAGRTGIERVGIAKWTEMVMPSLENQEGRQDLFGRMLKLASRKGIETLRISYDDAHRGASDVMDVVNTIKEG